MALEIYSAARSRQADQILQPEVSPLNLVDLGGRLRVATFTYHNDTGGTIPSGSQIILAKLPACRIISGEFGFSAWGGSRALSLHAYSTADPARGAKSSLVASPSTYYVNPSTGALATVGAAALSVSVATAGSGTIRGSGNISSTAGNNHYKRLSYENTIDEEWYLTAELSGGTAPDGAVFAGLILYVTGKDQ